MKKESIGRDGVGVHEDVFDEAQLTNKSEKILVVSNNSTNDSVNARNLQSSFKSFRDSENTDLKTSKLRNILKALDMDENVRLKSEFAKMVNFSDYKEHPIHRWFKYREGYSTVLIKRLLEQKGDQKRVLDPFCGSGTSLIAARELGINSIGFDINPLAAFVSEVKTRAYTKEDIELLRRYTENVLDISKVLPCPAPNLKIINKIFNSEILGTLLKIKHNIYNIKSSKHRDFLRLGWLAILEQVSNTRKEGNGIKYKFTKRTKHGYIPTPQNEWEDRAFGNKKSDFVLRTLKQKYDQMLDDVQKTPLKSAETRVYSESSLHLTDFIKSGTVTTAVFSPPYANCFDYFEIFKVELWMGEFIKSYKELRDLRNKAMRNNTNAFLDIEGREIYLTELDQLLELMDGDALWDRNLKKVVRGYFEDMHLVMEKVFEVLEPDGECIIVVGNSAYSNVIIPTDLLLSKIGRKIGYDNIKIFPVRHLTTSSQQRDNLRPYLNYLRESIVILKKPNNKSPIEVDELPVDEPINKNQRFQITSNNVAYLTHNIHKYPAKFIPQVPRWGIEKYQEKGRPNIILDPFCGSGTTLIEGMIQGHKTFGIDIDPLSRLISKVKTTKIEESILIKVVDDVIKRIDNKSRGNSKPYIPTLNHWFNEDAINALSIIRDAIDDYKEEEDIYDFLVICFSSIIRRVSNADNESQKTYVSHTNIKKPEDAKCLFKKNLRLYSTRLIDLFKIVPSSGKAKIFENCMDSRDFSDFWKKEVGNKVDIAITSPPYIKALDYIYTQMAEYFWIGDLFGLETQRLQNEYKTKYIGTKQVPASVYSKLLHTNYECVDRLVDIIYDIDQKHSYITAKFFLDMEKNIQNVGEVLRKGGHYIIVIGNNNVSNVPIPSNEIIAEIAMKNGFTVSNAFAYIIRNRYMKFPRKGRGGIIKEDWIVDLEKS